MVLSALPEKFVLFNDNQTKDVALVIQIEGLNDLISNRPIYENIRYGDPDLAYGDAGIVYGGLRRVGADGSREVRDILSLEGSSLTISQRIEPEQGRSSVSTLSLSLIDKNGYVTELVSPGFILDDIIGKRVKIWLGYEQISWPEQYFVIFRGRVTQIEEMGGRYLIQLSDPNVGRRPQIFYSAKTELTGAITNSQTTIPVISNSDFHRQILGPNGLYDSAIKTYIKVDDEFMEYSGTGFGVNSFTVTRGARFTAAVAHDADAEVQAWVEISDHCIDMALKLMLSGWNGPWKSDVAIESIVFTGDVVLGDQPGAIVLPPKTDAVQEYGLAVGDYLTVSGATNGVNNQTARVTGFGTLFLTPNRIIFTDSVTFVHEEMSPAVFSIRSQYDTYPITCASKIRGDEVDVAEHILLKNLFLAQAENSYRFLLGSQQSCKTFIESQLFLPSSAYSLTRQGRLSIGYSKPPLADDRLQFLDENNVLNPQNLRPTRGTNNRKFFNEIHWSWNFTDEGEAQSRLKALDVDSITIIDIKGILPIEAKGAYSDLGFETVIDRRSRFLLQRYKKGAIMIDAKVNWGTGCLIEAGDVVAVIDDVGVLQIPNFETGVRGLGAQLGEVIDRSLDIKGGNVTLKIIFGLGFQIDDRYGTIAPSSLVASGSTTTRVRIKESFGEIFPGREQDKWSDYFGLPIIIHSYDWATRYDATLLSLAPDDDHALIVDPPLSLAPTEDMIVDIGEYPTSTDVDENALYKMIHAFLTPTVDVVTGVSVTEFTVGAGDAAKFIVGNPILIHNADYTIVSPERKVVSVVGVTITVDDTLGFTPAAGQKIELIGFADGGGPYRFV